MADISQEISYSIPIGAEPVSGGGALIPGARVRRLGPRRGWSEREEGTLAVRGRRRIIQHDQGSLAVIRLDSVRKR